MKGLVEHETFYPPHAERLLEEHFYEFFVSNVHRFPVSISYVPIMWISHMHNLQLRRATYNPNEDDLVMHCTESPLT